MSQSPLLRLLACPMDGGALRVASNCLRCECGRHFPIVDGVPVIFPDASPANHPGIEKSRALVAGLQEEGASASVLPELPDVADVRSQIEYAGGFTQWDLAGTLTDYPVPPFDLPRRSGIFVDVGANWGRWAIAAARAGYDVIALDVQLEACRVARRITERLGLPILCIAADARWLPIRDGAVRMVHAYNVLQHFSRPDVERMLGEMRRVLEVGGSAVVQAPNRTGLRSTYHQLRRGFRPARGFEVRYWSPSALREVFERCLGPAVIEVDGFFSQNPRLSPAHQLPLPYRALIAGSALLTRLSCSFPVLRYGADSLRITATRMT